MTRPELRGLTARELLRALEADGFVWTRSKGSHRVYRHADGRRVVVTYHRPSGTFPAAKLADMLKGAGWGGDDLRRLGLLPGHHERDAA